MSDATPFGFGKFVPGFDFLQSLTKGASGGIPQIPQLSNWVAPTISVEELEKRIEELKAVQFWLDQNSRALTATVQALEVQKMTLATLKGMNVQMADVANAFKTSPVGAIMEGLQKAAPSFGKVAEPARAAPAHQADSSWPHGERAVPPTQAADAAVAPKSESSNASPGSAAAAHESADAVGAKDSSNAQAQHSSAEATTPGIVDPMQWWGALTQQFQQIATAALKDSAQQSALASTGQAAARMAQDAVKNATDMAGKMAAQGTKMMQAGRRTASGTAKKASAGTSAPGQRAAPTANTASKTSAKKAVGHTSTATAKSTSKPASRTTAKTTTKPAAKAATKTARKR